MRRVLASGCMRTVVWTEEKRLVEEKLSIGDHTEIQRRRWIVNGQPVY